MSGKLAMNAASLSGETDGSYRPLEDDSLIVTRKETVEDDVNDNPDNRSRSTSIIEYDKEPLPIDPLILESLSKISNVTNAKSSEINATLEKISQPARSISPRHLTSESEQPNGEEVERRRPSGHRLFSELLIKPTKLPQLLRRNSSAASLTPTSPSSRSSPRSSPRSSTRSSLHLSYRHSVSSPASPSRIPISSPAGEDTATSPFVFPKVLTEGGPNGAAGRRLGKVRSTTVQLKDKFVSELIMYTPCFGPPKTGPASPDEVNHATMNEIEDAVDSSTPNESASPTSGGSATKERPTIKQTSLGIFLATDMCYGQHTIYKISPLSVLSSMNLRVKDRIVKVNDFSVENWSHSCLIEFIKGLSLCATKKETVRRDGGGTVHVYETDLSLTVRRSNRVTRSISAMAVEDRVEARLTMEVGTGLRSSRFVAEEVRTRYRGHHHYRFQLADGSNLIVKIIPPSPGGAAAPTITLGYSTGHHNTECLIVHRYDVPPSLGGGVGLDGEGGQTVMVESPEGGSFLYAPSATTSTLALMPSSGALTAVTNVDSRFFRVAYTPSATVTLQHLMTGKFVTHATGGLSLVHPTREDRANSNLEFEMFSCSD